MSLFLKPRSGQSFATDTTDPLHDAFNIVPAFFLTQHAETIASGALARLFAMPKQRFTNADLAVYNARRFMDDIDRKAQRQMSGQQRAPVRTKAVWF